MNNIFSDPMTMGFCAFIILVAFISFVKLQVAIKKIITEIKGVNNQVPKSKHVIEVDDEGNEIEQQWTPSIASAFYQNFNAIDNLMRGASSLKVQWVAYCSTLQYPHKDFNVETTEEPKIRNTVSPSTLFTFSNVVSSKLNLRAYTSIPNILTGLGLLFTFIGLMMGISEAATGLSSGDIEAAKASLNPLLRGASIAFTTSVVGLFLSMLFSFYEKMKFHQVEVQVSKLTSLLTERVNYVNADTLATMQLSATQNQTIALESFQQEQQRATDSTIDRVCGEFRRSLFETTDTEFHKMSKFIGELNNSIKNNIELLNESHSKQQETHKKSCETLVKLTAKISTSLQDNLLKLEERELTRSERMLESFSKSIIQMESVNKDNSKHIFNTLENMNSEFEIQTKRNVDLVKTSTTDTVNSMMNEMQCMVKDNALQFTQTIKVNLAEVMNTTSNEFNKVSEHMETLNNSIQSNIEYLTNSQSNQQKVQEKSCDTLIALTDNITTSLQDNLESLEDREIYRSERILESFTQSIGNMDLANQKNSKNIFATLELMNSEFKTQTQKSVETVADSTAKSVNSMMHEMQCMVKENAQQFTETIKGNLDSIMDNLTADIKSSEQALTPLLNTLPNFVEKAQKVNEQLRNITQEQLLLTTNVRNTFAEVNKAGGLLNQSVDKLNVSNDKTLESNKLYMTIMDNVKLSVDSMQECATSIKVSSNEVNKVSDSQKEINRQIEVLMNNVFNKLNKGLTEYVDNTNTFMKSFSGQTLKIENSMGNVFTGLNNGLSEYSGQTNAYMQSLDEHTAQISGHLVEAINELKISIDDIKRKELAV